MTAAEQKLKRARDLRAVHEANERQRERMRMRAFGPMPSVIKKCWVSRTWGLTAFGKVMTVSLGLAGGLCVVLVVGVL